MDRSALKSLAPGDAAAALRSYPRRFREAFAPEELSEAPGQVDPSTTPAGGGPSPLGLVLAAGRATRALSSAIGKALVQDDPQLDQSVFDRATRDHPEQASGSLQAAFDLLDSATTSLARDIDRTPLAGWARPARVGGEHVDALELLREVVASGRTYLDRLGPTVEALRRQQE